MPLKKVQGDTLEAVAGWGHKPTADKARKVAREKNIPYIALEDGFFRSVQPGVTGAPPLSLVVDDQGIYYDATGPSRVETLLETGGWETPELLERSQNAIATIAKDKLSKYNHAPLLKKPLPGDRPQKVLVIDQTCGDASVSLGLASADSFHQMLTAACADNPDADIIIKTHPDVLAGKKSGYLTDTPVTDRTYLLAEEINPISLLERVDQVYTVTSQMGFEALLLGKPVHCFGVPFYAGWGLTTDRQKVSRRTHKRTFEELFAAACILYPRYLNPQTKECGTLEDALTHLSAQTHHLRSLDANRLLATNFRWWKQSYMRKVLRAPGCNLTYSNKPHGIDRYDKVAVWGCGDNSPVVAAAQKQRTPVTRIEDGFLRSVGLGSNLVQPLSLVFDSRGIYFDPTGPSDLEHLLQTSEFSDELCTRAATLRERIITGRLSKYNVGADDRLTTNAKPGQRVILVPGQVEDDASIRLGCVDLRTNAQLLAEVRRKNPDAYVIYKPHPDVLAGNRKGSLDGSTTSPLYDLLITDHAMPACLDVADEVHTLTSLTGFEALLRDKKVTCYGLPFYAGWGLTSDRHRIDRRTRALTLEQLIAGTLILYPRYIDWQHGEIIPVETALDRLEQKRTQQCPRLFSDNTVIGRWVHKLSGFLAGLR